MNTQHIVVQSAFAAPYESFGTQPSHFDPDGYVQAADSGMFTAGDVRVNVTSYRSQVRHSDAGLSGASNRRNRCRRASRACWLSVQLLSLQVARKNRKNSLWRPSPSRWSRPTQANTSNTGSGPEMRHISAAPVPSTHSVSRHLSNTLFHATRALKAFDSARSTPC